MCGAFLSGCSSARQNAWFGTKRPEVRILPPRLCMSRIWFAEPGCELGGM